MTTDSKTPGPRAVRSEQIDELVFEVGGRVELESLRQAVVPPYVMLVPFLETPPELAVEARTALDEDGVHGCTYRLRATAPCEGRMIVGFRDLRSGKPTHRKVIRVRVHPGGDRGDGAD